MSDFRVTHNVAGLARRVQLSAVEFRRASVRALNKTMTTVRAEGARELADLYPGIKIGTIKARISMDRATAARSSGALSFSGKRFRLYGNWVNAQTKTGVRLGASRRPWRLETLDGTVVTEDALAHAFIQRSTKTGKPHVWIRVGAARYPITALLGSSLAEAFDKKGIGPKLIRISKDRFAVIFQQEARFAMIPKGP